MSSPHNRFLLLMIAMRPNHWIKNLVVFAAAIFGMQFNGHSISNVLIAFLAFSFISSATYLLNDVMDVQADREHPKKCKRPIAAGLVSIPMAISMAFILLLASLWSSFYVSGYLGLCVLAYTAVQIGYNLGLKHKTIVDILCISAGFVLRALAGAAAVAVIPSSWFILCVGLLALYLGIEKRKAEVKSMGNSGTTRKVLQHYSIAWLTRMESIVTASVLMCYCLWTVEGAQTPWQMITIPFVIYGIFKYQYLSEQGQGEAPEVTIVRSPHLLINIVLWVVVNILVLVLRKPAMVLSLWPY